jgi:NTE family protein
MANKTALVLSGGGLFGAYQAGAWKALESRFQPDVVVGASVGSLNGWAIAGGCAGEDLERYWLDSEFGRRHRLRLPRSFRHGILDNGPLRTMVRRIHDQYRPKLDFAVVLTELLRMKPKIFHGPEITWQHLAGSCGIPGILDQYRIDGRTYTDGGLLAASPLWAAAALGVDRIVAINVLPRTPGAVLSKLVVGLRRVVRFQTRVPDSIEVIELGPQELLGSARDAMVWDRERIQRWMKLGEEAVEKHSIWKCFEG